MPRKRECIAPIPANFFFADSVRSTMHPTLIAAMTLAYQWSEILGTNGFLTEPQLFQALGQISAHGVSVESVIRDLLALKQLEEFGFGYQLPSCSAYRVRQANAQSHKKNYKGKKRGHKPAASPCPIPNHTMGYRDRMKAEAAGAGFSDERPSGVYPIAACIDSEVASEAASDGDRNRDLNGRGDSVPTSDCSAASLHRPERSTIPRPQEVPVGSGPCASAQWQTAEQSQSRTPASQGSVETEPEAEPTVAAADVGKIPAGQTYGLSASSLELVEELIAKIGNRVSALPPKLRGEQVGRAEYAPPPSLLARWVEVLPMNQILADLARYRLKGNSDITAVREHDSCFESFMQSSLEWKHQRVTRRLERQNAAREALKRQAKQNNDYYKTVDWSKVGTGPEHAKRVMPNYVNPIAEADRATLREAEERHRKWLERKRAAEQAKLEAAAAVG